MRTDIEERACDLALYIIEHQATVRSAAKQFGISKSTVHKDLSQRLPAFKPGSYLQVKEVLDLNKAERHIGVELPPAANIKERKTRFAGEKRALRGQRTGAGKERSFRVCACCAEGLAALSPPPKGGNPSTRGSRLPGRLHCSNRWGYSTEIK